VQWRRWLILIATFLMNIWSRRVLVNDDVQSRLLNAVRFLDDGKLFSCTCLDLEHDTIDMREFCYSSKALIEMSSDVVGSENYAFTVV